MHIEKDRISLHVCTKNRPAELLALLQSLRTQEYTKWDLVLLDDGSQIPIINIPYVSRMLDRLKLEGHYINVERLNKSDGVCNARNTLIEKDYFNNEYTCRLDDDVLPESDYLDILVDTIKKGYDLVSGVTPNLSAPDFGRLTKFVAPVINKHTLDKKGNLIDSKDDCGFQYIDHAVLLTHQFRSCCLYKSSINATFRYPTNLSPIGFREEGYLSLFCITNNLKMVVNTSAIVFHIRSPTGGARAPDYNEAVKIDDEYFKKYLQRIFQEKGDIFSKYTQKMGERNDTN